MIYEGLVRYVIVTVDTNDVAKGDDADSIASRRIRLSCMSMSNDVDVNEREEGIGLSLSAAASAITC